MWLELIIALGLVFFIEGVAWALFPNQLKRLLVALMAQSAANIRLTGLTLATIGVAIVWMVKG